VLKDTRLYALHCPYIVCHTVRQTDPPKFSYSNSNSQKLDKILSHYTEGKLQKVSEITQK